LVILLGTDQVAKILAVSQGIEIRIALQEIGLVEAEVQSLRQCLNSFVAFVYSEGGRMLSDSGAGIASRFGYH
jgi:hypothetical protein